jgi:hypothetical protein
VGPTALFKDENVRRPTLGCRRYADLLEPELGKGEMGLPTERLSLDRLLECVLGPIVVPELLLDDPEVVKGVAERYISLGSLLEPLACTTEGA